MNCTIEFYKNDARQPFLSQSDCAFTPNENDLITIGPITYVVIGRSFNIDYLDQGKRFQSMRCNIFLKERIK